MTHWLQLLPEPSNSALRSGVRFADARTERTTLQGRQHEGNNYRLGSFVGGVVCGCSVCRRETEKRLQAIPYLADRTGRFVPERGRSYWPQGRRIGYHFVRQVVLC